MESNQIPLLLEPIEQEEKDLRDGCAGEDLDYELSRLADARHWPESQPTATDKAVCPKCGTISFLFEGESMAECPKCDDRFSVKVLVISPPRAPKVTP